MIGIHVVILLMALVCFVLAALEVPSPRVNLIALGLALWVLDLMIR